MVAWGADLVATNVHFWAKAEAARRRGVRSSSSTRAAAAPRGRADRHLRIRIGTDAALALGVMHILARDGLVDRAYIAAHTHGFDRLEAEVLPRFPPARVAAITGLDEDDIEGFAALYGRERVVYPSWRGHDPAGARRRGAARGGAAARRDRRLRAARRRRTAADRRLVRAELRRLAAAVRARPRRGSSTIRGSATRCSTMADPPLRALFVAANNPAVTCPDAGKVRRGLLREDLFTVVHDPFLSVTARYADIVLPATTYLETEDFYRAYGTYWMQYGRAAVPPQGEAWSNLRLAQELARRMGLSDPVFRMSQAELLSRIVRGRQRPRRRGRSRRAALGASDALRRTGSRQEFRTPSGRLEFYSEQLAASGAPSRCRTGGPTPRRNATRPTGLCAC